MEAPQKKSTAEKSTEMSKRVRGMVKGMSQKAHQARAEGEPVAYSFVQGCYDEILAAMDVATVGTENWAGLCAAKLDAERFILKANAEGYPNHLCTYATCGLGYEAMRRELGGDAPPSAPDGGMASPTVMLGTGMMICDPRYKWYQSARRYVDVPVNINGLLWPPVDADLDEVRERYIRYNLEELRDLVDFLERHLGRKMDWDRLAETVDLAERTVKVWYEAYQLRKAVPSPMPTEDALNTMVPGFFMLGTQETLDFYRELYDEIKYRLDNKIGVIPEEKYRLLWGAGLPPWFGLIIFNYFESLGAVFPIENAYPPPFPAEVPATVTDPLERIVRRQFYSATYYYDKARRNSGDHIVEWLLDMIREYKIDGVVCHRAITCRTIHVGQIHLLNVLKKYTDIPTLVLESDIVDVRAYSEADTHAKIDAFIEIVDAYKRKAISS
ncbi:2-hydroxyacyl-CoA dehydratase subunit D [Chloroflexota bacterium]